MSLKLLFGVLAVIAFGVKGLGIQTGQIDMSYIGWCLAGIEVLI